MFKSTRMLVLALVAAATTASAQAVDAGRVPVSDSAAVVVAQAPVQAGPRIDATSVAIRQTVRASAPVALAAARGGAGMGRPMALILVGLGGIAIGDVMDDDIGTLFSITGAVLLLVGLYELVR